MLYNNIEYIPKKYENVTHLKFISQVYGLNDTNDGYKTVCRKTISPHSFIRYLLGLTLTGAVDRDTL